MSADYQQIEAEIRYLTTAEGGRRQGVFSGYRGQFHYLDEDCDGFQYFPDVPDRVMVELGTTVRAFVSFPETMWKSFHAARITVGMPFEIREGRKVVGRGIVTKFRASDDTIEKPD